MPELPEIEALRRQLLADGLAGERISGATIGWPGAIRGNVEEFVLGVLRQRVEDAQRRGKWLALRFERGGGVIFHMRMTGWLALQPSKTPRPKFTHNALSLASGRELRFVDARKLGTMQLSSDLEADLSHNGPEPLDAAFTERTLAQILRKRTAPVKAALCDQRLIAGIGNIYADEMLFAAGVRPYKPAGGIGPKRRARLHAVMVASLSEAVNRLAEMPSWAGPAMEPSVDKEHFLVPRSEGAPCRVCASPIRKVTIRGRSSYYCRRCQR